MKYSSSAGAVLVGPTNQVGVVSQHGTSWSLLKGTLDGDETDTEALKRELIEEAGITDFQVIKELGTYERYIIGKHGGEDKSHYKTITIYLCTTLQKTLRPQDPENPEARWVNPEKVAELLTHPKDQQFYLQVLPEVKKFIATRKN